MFNNANMLGIILSENRAYKTTHGLIPTKLIINIKKRNKPKMLIVFLRDGIVFFILYFYIFPKISVYIFITASFCCIILGLERAF